MRTLKLRISRMIWRVRISNLSELISLRYEKNTRLKSALILCEKIVNHTSLEYFSERREFLKSLYEKIYNKIK